MKARPLGLRLGARVQPLWLSLNQVPDPALFTFLKPYLTRLVVLTTDLRVGQSLIFH